MVYRELLRRVEDQARGYGDTLQAPCDGARLARLRERVRNELRSGLPEEYAGFLRLTDGMNWNGLYVYPSETSPIAGHPEHVLAGIVETNLDLREGDRFDDLLVFAEDSLDVYARRVSTGEFMIFDRISHDPIEAAPSFDALMGAALRRRQS